MNKIKAVFLLLLFLSILSCSSSGDSAIVDAPSVLKVNINGEEIINTSTSTVTFKTESKMSFEYACRCEFDTSGHFGFFRIDVPIGTSGVMRTFTSFKYFSSHYFTFNLESLDEVHKRVKGSFAGYLYANPTDLNSEKKYVNGTFDLKYRDLVPGVFGTKNQAKINGNQWSKIYRESSNFGESLSRKFTHEDYSDDEYKITINYELPNYISTLPAVTYNFGNTDVTNNVRLAKFDVATGNFINYNTTGAFAITKFENYIITGNYTFTAVNPNDPSDIIQVTEGEYKIRYYYF